MADVVANYMVEQQGLRTRILEQRAAVARQKLAIMEMSDRKRRHEENIAASLKAIGVLEEEMATGTATGEATDVRLRQQRLRMQVAELRATVERQQLAILEMQDRKIKAEEIVTAALAAAEHYEVNLKAMAEAHGKLTDDIYETMLAAL